MTKKFLIDNPAPSWIFIFMILSSTLVFSQAETARVTSAVDNTSVVLIPRTHHPLAMPAGDRGRASAGTPMERMVLVLKPSNQQAAKLARLVSAQHDKQSSSYHNWLTPEQYGSEFGPAQQDLDQVSTWLQQQGFRVDRIARGRQWIEFSGNAAQVEGAFHTEIHRYRVKGEDHVANSADISVPRALATVISGVLSLHDFRKHPAHGRAFQIRRDSSTGKLAKVAELVPSQNGFTSQPYPEFTLEPFTHFLAPGDFSRIYNTLPLLQAGTDGSSISIAVVGRTDINLSDVQTFRQTFGLPANDPTFIVNGQDPGVNGDEIESALDVEWAGAVAPKAKINFVTTGSTFTTDGVDLSASYIVDNVVAPIMSSSYGQCEAFLGTAENAFLNSLYQQAAAEGITIFVSSGDNGAAGCDSPVSFFPAQNGLNVNGVASTPYNVAVGGTEFKEHGLDQNYWLTDNRPDLSSAIGYIPEAVWNESCDPTVDPTGCGHSGLFALWSGSGGASSCTQSTISGSTITCVSGYPKPSWQAGIGVTSDGVRDLPDVSLAAAGSHDGYLVCLEGSCQTIVVNGQIVLQNASVVGGTSAAAPSMAGVMALVEQQNGSYQGLANYSLYQLAAAEKLLGCNSSKLTDPTAPTACVFYDVTSGNNSVPGQVGFSAGRGYDMGSGLGSVNAANLVSAWSSVHKLGSSTSLSASTSTIQHGTPLPLTVGVTPMSGSGVPSGDFSIISSKYGSVLGGTLSSGNFSGGVNGLSGGHYNIQARYSGDAMFKASNSSSIPLTVTPEPSETTASGWEVNLAGFVVPLFGPVNYGQPVAIQFDVKGKSGIGSATGAATITLDNSVNLGTFPLNAGGSGWVQVDNLTATGLQTGLHTFTVSYAGDNSFHPSQSVRLPVRVRRVLPNGFASSYPDAVTVGSPVRLQFAVLSEGILAPTGTVNLYDNGKKIAGPLALTYHGLFGAGLAQVSYTASGLEAGFHNFKLTYSGDANHLPLPQNTFSNHGAFVSVAAATGAAARVSLSPSSSSVSLGGSVTYSVTVTPAKAGGPLPTGTVTLVGENGGPFDDPVKLTHGNASIVLNWPFVRQNGIVAEYSGDSNYSASTSPFIITNVTQGIPTVTLTAAAGIVTAGTQSSVTVSTLGLPSNPNVAQPYGQVEFFDSVNGGPEHLFGGTPYLTTGNGGSPIFTLPVTLPPGSNVIHARYLGSADWKAADSNKVTVVVK